MVALASTARPLKVGLTVSAYEDPATSHASTWEGVKAFARNAEDAGFDSLHLGDHLLLRFGPEVEFGPWEAVSTMAAIAASTDHIQLGLLTACTAYRNPALLAKMAVTIDEVSGGRFSLGLGAGWHEPEFRAFGYPFDHRVDRFEEALVIITTLLREGRIDFDGKYHQARDCELLPRGPRPGGLPIVMGAKGPRMLRLAARYADTWNRDFVPESTIGELANWQARLDAACLEVDRAPATLRRTAALTVDLPGAEPREPFWNALTGTPEQLAESLRAYAAAGISEVQVWLEPHTIAGIETFARTLELLDAG